MIQEKSMDSDETVYYVTKYALTKGILKVNGSDEGDGMLRVEGVDGMMHMYYHGEGREWHRNAQSALYRANKMRGKAIEYALKKISRLESMEFEIPV